MNGAPTPTDWAAQREPTTIEKLLARIEALEKQVESLNRRMHVVVRER